MALWQQVLRQNITSFKALVAFLELSQEEMALIDPRPDFPLMLPLRLARKVGKPYLNDPILRQLLPLKQEQEVQEGSLLDPVQDGQFRRAPRLLKKYQGRALLLCTQACPMHCRFCFRRHFAYAAQEASFSDELQLIREDESLSEILLSGGDPLALPDPSLGRLLDELSRIPHIKRLRIHTRFPIGIPERIDAPFLDLLSHLRLQVLFVLHCNHPRELDADVLAGLERIRKLGIPVLTQTVLLRGVNDEFDILYELCSLLIDHGILPYYLHQLDRVQGAMHFEVSEAEGLALVRQLAARLPGYAVPRYVKEEPGLAAKQPICMPQTTCGRSF